MIKTVNGYVVHISDSVNSIWTQFKQIKPHQKESCGVLIGSFDYVKQEVTVEACTTPLKQDISRKFSFTLKDPGHQRVVDSFFQMSDGESFYLGTWHTHPEDNPRPSHTDLMDWQNCVNRNPHIPVFLFVIIGVKNNYLEVRK